MTQLGDINFVITSSHKTGGTLFVDSRPDQPAVCFILLYASYLMHGEEEFPLLGCSTCIKDIHHWFLIKFVLKKLHCCIIS